MEALVGDEQYGGFLKSRDAMRDFCREHPESALDHGFFSFGFRADTAQYACLIQLHPYKAEENLFIYCYRHDWLERHMEQAEKGIRFIDPHYKELFRIPDGGQIRISAGQNGGRVWMQVDDNGIGIPAEDRPRIFERFYRVDKARSRQSGGTGLGLSIAKEIVDRHEGALELVDRDGPGLSVRMELNIEGPSHDERK